MRQQWCTSLHLLARAAEDGCSQAKPEPTPKRLRTDSVVLQTEAAGTAGHCRTLSAQNSEQWLGGRGPAPLTEASGAHHIRQVSAYGHSLRITSPSTRCRKVPNLLRNEYDKSIYDPDDPHLYQTPSRRASPSGRGASPLVVPLKSLMGSKRRRRRPRVPFPAEAEAEAGQWGLSQGDTTHGGLGRV